MKVDDMNGKEIKVWGSIKTNLYLLRSSMFQVVYNS